MKITIKENEPIAIGKTELTDLIIDKDNKFIVIGKVADTHTKILNLETKEIFEYPNGLLIKKLEYEIVIFK